jgi:hypothetical protein
MYRPMAGQGCFGVHRRNRDSCYNLNPLVTSEANELCDQLELNEARYQSELNEARN